MRKWIASETRESVFLAADFYTEKHTYSLLLNYHQSGAEKDVFLISDDEVVAVFRRSLRGKTLEDKIVWLAYLKNKLDIPVVPIKKKGKISISNEHDKIYPAIIMLFYPAHSKEICTISGGEVAYELDLDRMDIIKKWCDENSLASLNAIQKALKKAKAAVMDLQFLIDWDGSFVVNDPAGLILKNDCESN